MYRIRVINVEEVPPQSNRVSWNSEELGFITRSAVPLSFGICNTAYADSIQSITLRLRRYTWRSCRSTTFGYYSHRQSIKHPKQLTIGTYSNATRLAAPKNSMPSKKIVRVHCHMPTRARPIYSRKDNQMNDPHIDLMSFPARLVPIKTFVVFWLRGDIYLRRHQQQVYSTTIFRT